jgi:hypothetical protein
MPVLEIVSMVNCLDNEEYVPVSLCRDCVHCLSMNMGEVECEYPLEVN